VKTRFEEKDHLLHQTAKQYTIMQTLPHNATSNQIVVKIIGLIIFIFDMNQSFLRRLLNDHCPELIRGKNNQLADIMEF
jgi:hypothetical protein